MDVEGAEPQVVRGAERLLREDRPVILSELHPTQLARASGVTADAFLDQMKALGYRAHAIEGGGDVGAPIDRAPAEALVSIVLIPSPLAASPWASDAELAYSDASHAPRARSRPSPLLWPARRFCQPSRAVPAPIAPPLSPRNASYTITAQLDPATRTITGSETITWRNITTTAATELQFHLYWNAWKDTRSTFMRERALGGSSGADRGRTADDWSRIDVTSIKIGGRRSAPPRSGSSRRTTATRTTRR